MGGINFWSIISNCKKWAYYDILIKKHSKLVELVKLPNVKHSKNKYQMKESVSTFNIKATICTAN